MTGLKEFDGFQGSECIPTGQTIPSGRPRRTITKSFRNFAFSPAALKIVASRSFDIGRGDRPAWRDRMGYSNLREHGSDATLTGIAAHAELKRNPSKPNGSSPSNCGLGATNGSPSELQSNPIINHTAPCLSTAPFGRTSRLSRKVSFNENVMVQRQVVSIRSPFGMQTGIDFKHMNDRCEHRESDEEMTERENTETNDETGNGSGSPSSSSTDCSLSAVSSEKEECSDADKVEELSTSGIGKTYEYEKANSTASAFSCSDDEAFSFFLASNIQALQERAEEADDEDDQSEVSRSCSERSGEGDENRLLDIDTQLSTAQLTRPGNML